LLVDSDFPPQNPNEEAMPTIEEASEMNPLLINIFENSKNIKKIQNSDVLTLSTSTAMYRDPVKSG
jgi:hypothetical protein